MSLKEQYDEWQEKIGKRKDKIAETIERTKANEQITEGFRKHKELREEE